jgi:diacylglycerol kinase family enzyme
VQNRQRSQVAIILKGDAPGADCLPRESCGFDVSSVAIALHATRCAGHAIEFAQALAPSVDYLLAGNGRYFGSGLAAIPDAHCDSGELAVTLIGDVSVFDFLRKLPAVCAGRRIEHPQVSCHRACSLEVSHGDRAYGMKMYDEFLGQTPARIEVNAGAVRMLLP